ncbi:MAG: hypothetical protein WC299_09510 [Kiritimatiellia bacterium]
MIISDMSRCRPASALSQRECSNRWQVLAYRTCDREPKGGLMIGAPSFVAAPEVQLPLGVSGWHDISIGIWIPKHDYDGAVTVKVKLDNDPCFIRLSEPEPVSGSQPRDGASLVVEAHFKAADLTGRRLIFGKAGGSNPKKAYIAYVRLTPLDMRGVQELKADRARTDTRILQAAIDGISFFSTGEYRTRDQILELVEPYRHSDVGKVTWAFCYGDSVNYPSKIGAFLGSDRPSRNNYHENFRRLAAAGHIPQKVAAEHVHGMGLKFEAMFRLGMFGRVPPRRWLPPGKKLFIETHPQCRLCMSDGTPVEKASYAFPEVRAHMLAIIRESALIFEIDGVSLAFNRGPFFAAWEQPVMDDFRREFGGDARALPLDHPDLARIRCRYLTEFVRDARKVLDEAGAARGKRLELGVWFEGQTRAQREYGGVDVETWINEGLLDSAVGSVGKNDAFDPLIISAAKKHGCKSISGIVCSGGTTHGQRPGFLDNAARRLYPAGGDGIAIWDSDTVTAGAFWPLMRRMGHRDEFIQLAKGSLERPYIALKEVNGCNLETENGRFGLGQAAYSCG